MRNVTTTFLQQVFTLCPHNALSSGVGTLRLRKEEDSYSWSVGINLGVLKNTDFQDERSVLRGGSPAEVKFSLKWWLLNSIGLNSLSLYDMLVIFNLLGTFFFNVAIVLWRLELAFLSFLRRRVSAHFVPGTLLNSGQDKGLLL